MNKKSTKEQEYLNDLKRVQADFINFKKRVDEDKKNWLKFANVGLLTKLIPVLDNFERAKAHMPANLKNDEFVAGLMAIEKEFRKLLDEEGVERIETKGAHFDPNLHEVLMYVDATEPEGQIIEELEAGYKIGDNVIKAAKVKVSKGDKK